MSLKYAKISNIKLKLASRITIVDSADVNLEINSLTGTSIGTDLIEVIGESVEEFMDLYIEQIYVTPLKREHTFLSNIAEKLIISDLYTSVFATSAEGNDGSEGYYGMLRTQALNDFQILFQGVGLFVSGVSTNNAQEIIQNDANSTQQQVKPLILPGEEIKGFVGIDYTGDNISDTNLFKLDTVSPSFYMAGNMEEFEEDVVNGIRVKEYGKRYTNRADIDFFNR